MAADRGCIGRIRVAAELCLQPPEARQFRVPSFRRQVVPQVVKVRRPHSPLVETGQDVRREVVDGGLEAGGRDRFRVRRADIGKQHRIRFRRRLGGEERQQPVRKDRDVGPSIAAADGRHVVGEIPVVRGLFLGGPPELPSQPPPVPNEPLGDGIGGKARSVAKLPAVGVFDHGEMSAVHRHREQAERRPFLRRVGRGFLIGEGR